MIAATALLLLCPQQQQPPPIPSAEELLATWNGLTEERKALVARNLERRVQLDPTPAIQRIIAKASSFSALPVAEPPPHHDPARWAPDAAPERSLVRTGSAHHRRVRETFPDVPFLPDLDKAVWYDWRTGRVVRREQRLDADETFENLVHGYPPGADFAAAEIQKALDTRPIMRVGARWFGHLYADRDGHVFEDITLYDAWYSGSIVEVPDVDAIAFAVRILKDTSYQSPIPADARRAALYEKIKRAALLYRKYRTTIEAAAAAWVAADPPIDPAYAGLIPRFHHLEGSLGHDIDALAETLDETPDRDAFLAAIDERFRADPEAAALRDRVHDELATMAERLRAHAWVAVRR